MSQRKRAGRPASKRQLRVGEELRHALSEILAREEVRDPALAGVSVTVTAVDASPDLRHATAFVVPLGGANQQAVVDALNQAAKWLRGRVARQVQLKFAPTIDFALDRSFDQAERIEALLRQPELTGDLAPRAMSDEADDGP